MSHGSSLARMPPTGRVFGLRLAALRQPQARPATQSRRLKRSRFVVEEFRFAPFGALFFIQGCYDAALLQEKTDERL